MASHPRKGPPSRRTTPKPEGSASPGTATGSASPQAETTSSQYLKPVLPLTSAWDECIIISSNGVEYQVRLSALQTRLQSVARLPIGANANGFFNISLPLYSPTELQPFMDDDDFNANANCFLHLASPDSVDSVEESLCTFIFEVSNSKLAMSVQMVES